MIRAGLKHWVDGPDPFRSPAPWPPLPQPASGAPASGPPSSAAPSAAIEPHPGPVEKVASLDQVAPVKKAAPAKKAAAAKKTPPAKKAPVPPAAWVEPDPSGTAPATHPVKAKLSSHVFHLPGMSAYHRTRPDRCYATAEAAEADGFVRAKR